MTEDITCNTIVICPVLTTERASAAKSPTSIVSSFSSPNKSGSPFSLRSSEAELEEAVSLAEAIHLNVVYSCTIKVSTCRASTYIGKGSLEKIKELVSTFDAELVIMDCSLSPMQQRNLEKTWRKKVIDRTALILEIFGERACTKEGVLQVELAHLTYQKSRLVKSWTHLERQRGGSGFLGGPGEKQIEMDRRIIGEKITRLKKELEDVKRTRQLHRKARQKVPYPIIALVGYTNAGKSTLFNQITGASVYAENQLFATLDPTMRQIRLPKGTKVILSDTVGFISRLPTELVAAFRATLEEVLEADIILHVRDVTHPDTLAQKEDVINILKGLGLEDKLDSSTIEVLNKVDLLDTPNSNVSDTMATTGKLAYVSALYGRGIDELLCKIEDKISANWLDLSVRIKAEDGATISWLYRHGEVINQENKDDITIFHVRMNKTEAERFRAYMQNKNNDS